MRFEKSAMKKNEKKLILVLDGVKTPCYIEFVPDGSMTRTKTMAPNQRDKDKRILNIYIDAERYQALKRRAKQLDTTVTGLLTLFIIEQTNDVQLTKEDYEEIIRWKEGR